MAVSELTLHTLVLALSAATTATTAAVASRQREIPGATPFAALMGSLAAWSTVYGVGLHVHDPAFRMLLLRVQWTAVPVVTVALFLFAAAYTGTDGFVSRRSVALIGAIPAVTVLAAWTNPWHRLLWSDQTVRVVDGMALMAPTFGPLFWFFTIYGYTLVAVSMALMIRLVYQSDYLYADQSALVLVGVAAPFLVNVVDVFVGAGNPKVDYTPVSFAVTGLAFGYALFRRQLFDFIPATRKIGRDTAISQLETGVVIVDTGRRVVYCNDAAADVLGCEPAAALGRGILSFVAEDAVDVGSEGGLAEFDRGERTYEIRTSPITDRHDRLIGHTLVIHDVTARKERERELVSQRDELATLNDLNAVIRGVNQALVSARSREEIERAVCDRIADADLYRRVCVADVATWTGDADRWTVAGDGETDPELPAITGDGLRSGIDTEDGPAVSLVSEAGESDWAVVPLVYGRTVYGALGLQTDREVVGEREQSILVELGEIVGHAINAVETRQLLSAESLVEVELGCHDSDDPLVAATTAVPCRVELEGIVPSGNDGPVAYFRVDGAEVSAVGDVFADVTDGSVRVVNEGTDNGDSGGLLEWQITGAAPLGTLVDHGANVHRVSTENDAVHYQVDIASGSDVRVLVDHLQERFRDIQVLRKREKSQSVEVSGVLPDTALAGLTDRQREVLEAAYRSGYFAWPRDSNAEEVADSLGISSATLHSHLRKAEQSLLNDLFERVEERRAESNES